MRKSYGFLYVNDNIHGIIHYFLILRVERKEESIIESVKFNLYLPSSN
jgi:hypothetical protein